MWCVFLRFIALFFLQHVNIENKPLPPLRPPRGDKIHLGMGSQLGGGGVHKSSVILPEPQRGLFSQTWVAKIFFVTAPKGKNLSNGRENLNCSSDSGILF